MNVFFTHFFEVLVSFLFVALHFKVSVSFSVCVYFLVLVVGVCLLSVSPFFLHPCYISLAVCAC